MNLTSLSSKLDRIIQFDDDDDRKNGSMLGTVAKAGVGAGAIGGGLYAAGNAGDGVLDRIGQGATRTSIYAQKAGRSAGQAAEKYASLRAGSEVGLGLSKTGAAKSALSGLAGKLKNLKFSKPPESVVELDAKLDGILEFEEEPRDDKYVLRGVLGNAPASFINAKKGNRMKAFAHAYQHKTAQGVMGGALGAGAGAGIGALAGLRHSPGKAAAMGAMVGGVLGLVGGTLKGNYDKKATEIFHKYAQ